jgi:hypothetical protein
MGHLNTCISPKQKCDHHVTSKVKIHKIATELYCCKKWQENNGKIIHACEPGYKEAIPKPVVAMIVGRELTWLDGYTT